MTRRVRGRYTPETVERICAVLAEGNTRRTAAAIAGIDETTLWRWMNRHAEFAERVKTAEQEAVRRNVAIIQRAAEKSWQAAAWWLERRYPADFGAKTQHTTDDAATAKLDELIRRAEEAARNVARDVQSETG